MNLDASADERQRAGDKGEGGEARGEARALEEEPDDVG
jgi:hypothetical protein